jgi:KipI family sensor histidine kinase inhibitor
VNVSPLGDRALRIEVADLATAHRLRAAIIGTSYDVIDVVPGWRTVVVTTSGDVDALTEQLRSLKLAHVDAPTPRTHVIPARYDGPDIDVVAQHTGLTADEVVRRHAAATYTVAFLGFQPGFPYLAGLDPALSTPRRETPRKRVAAGAVGIAGDVTGIYPRPSPGGWQLIAHTDVTFFDASTEPPALLAPGDTVQFQVAP